MSRRTSLNTHHSLLTTAQTVCPFLQYLYDVLYSLYISEERISTMITVNSTFSRIVGFAALGISGLLIPEIKLKTVLVTNFEMAVIASLILIDVFVCRSRADQDSSSSIR